MIKEFEGKSEQEAIDKAIEALNLDREEFDVEIVENLKKGMLFKKSIVKIRVHIEEDDDILNDEPETEFETDVINFLSGVIERMGYEASFVIQNREEHKICIGIQSKDSGIIIGKKGKNLDALQLLANVFAGKHGVDQRVIIDSENYRNRREENLIAMAKKTAQHVLKSRRSRLLDPMNPFERRLIHTTLNDMDHIETKSEGDGLYKQVRISYKN